MGNKILTAEAVTRNTGITTEGMEWAAACGIDPVEPLMLEDEESAFAAQLRGWMGEQKLEVRDLARVLGVTPRKAKSIWRGTATITMSVIADLAAWQGKTPVQLITEVQAMLDQQQEGDR